MADLPPPPDGSSPFWPVAAGLLAGAIWRLPRWFSKEGLKKQLFIRDAAALGVLGILSMVICRIFSLTGEYAALVGAATMLVGVDAIRKYAMDALIQWANKRLGVNVKIDPEAEG